MSLWGALAGGFLGTIVLTTTLRAASELRLTRMDIPFLLGTGFTAHRLRAKVIGYLLHFAIGLFFALLYYAIFLALDESSWWLGALLGLAHGTAVTTALINDLPPLIHPRMGSTMTAANTSALLEPPGFLMLNYGTRTPIVNIAAHIAYGTIVGTLTTLTH
jgi:hypothetical protein